MARKTVLMLGLGRQGAAALHDLVGCQEIDRILVADSRPDLASALAAHPADRVEPFDLDITDPAAVENAMRCADLVVEALPAPFAPSLGRIAASVGVPLVCSVNYVDQQEADPDCLRTMQDAANNIDHLARVHNVAILTEFGLDPGIDLVLGARASAEFDELHEFRTYGAGIPDPVAAKNPIGYKFSWSPLGVMRAYRRPARIITGGKEMKIAGRDIFASENVHNIGLPELGIDLECYPNGDAVRYAQQFGLNGSIREMARYTCRLPGHCAFWRIAAECGFLDEDPVQVGKVAVAPVQAIAAILDNQEQFRYADDEQDVALVRVDLRGILAGRKRRVVYQLLDRRDLATGLTAMQRTVGFTLGLGARLLLTGRLERTGLLTPLDVPFDDFASGLARHGLAFARQESDWK